MSQRPTCALDGCDKRLRSYNKVGYCTTHRRSSPEVRQWERDYNARRWREQPDYRRKHNERSKRYRATPEVQAKIRAYRERHKREVRSKAEWKAKDNARRKKRYQRKRQETSEARRTAGAQYVSEMLELMRQPYDPE